MLFLVLVDLLPHFCFLHDEITLHFGRACRNWTAGTKEICSAYAVQLYVSQLFTLSSIFFMGLTYQPHHTRSADNKDLSQF